MIILMRFSYLLVSLILLVAVGTASATLGWGSAGQIGTLVLAALLAIYWVAARYGAVTPADPEKKIRRARATGRPVVVHFYSDGGLGCLLQRPGARRIQRAYEGHCEFILVNVGHPEAAGLMKSLGASLGSYLYFDAAGGLVEQSRRLTAGQVQHLLNPRGA